MSTFLPCAAAILKIALCWAEKCAEKVCKYCMWYLFNDPLFCALLQEWLCKIQERRKRACAKKTVERKYWNVSEQTMMDLFWTSAHSRELCSESETRGSMLQKSSCTQCGIGKKNPKDFIKIKSLLILVKRVFFIKKSGNSGPSASRW